MRPRRAALLTPPSPTPAFLQNIAKSCICHTSEKSPVTPIIATDPKTRSRKSCVCHTCDPLPPPPFPLLLLFLLPSRVTRHGRRKDRKSTRLNSSHSQISYAVFCLKKKAPAHRPVPNRRLV